MKNWSLTNGYEVVQVLRGRSNSYVVCTGRGNLLIDTGPRNSRKTLMENLRVTGPGTTGIEFVILTHSHFDHCGNAAYLSRKFGSGILLGERETGFAESGMTHIPKGSYPVTRVISGLGKTLGDHVAGYEPFKPFRAISGDFSLKPDGYDALIIETPGHTAGSVSVIINNEIAIVGDTLFGIFKNSVFPPYADDPELLATSWARLLGTGCRLFLPGHGSEITLTRLQKETDFFQQKLKSANEQRKT